METFLPPVFGKEMGCFRARCKIRPKTVAPFKGAFSLSETSPSKKRFYFSTRDLLIMAVLAALGGVASTYINTLSDAVHAVLGIPGATQWAAGLHVLWIVLAMGISGKTGTGTLTGVMKGAVELMSGNSHGVIILLVNLVAGLLVDFGFLIFRNKGSLLPYLLAGGLATGSNVLVFQLFATMPLNILAASAILILFLVAFASGLVFAGFIPRLLISGLSKAGVVRQPVETLRGKKYGWYILLGVFVVAALLGLYLKATLKGPGKIQINGAVAQPYAFPSADYVPERLTQQMEYRGVMTEYTGFPLLDLIEYAQPDERADMLLIKASDGYKFLLSFDELRINPNILLAKQGQGQNVSFDIVGPESSKAWVRNVTELTVIASESLIITNSLSWSSQFVPDAWLEDMDSTQINLPEGVQKLQGVPVWKLVEANAGENEEFSAIVFKNYEGNLELTWTELDGNDQIRIFTVIQEESLSFALAEMSGQVLLYPVNEIEIQ
jgi:energy-coupling factor transport system substrate-specific component